MSRIGRTNWAFALAVSAATAVFLGLVGGGLLRLEVPRQHWFTHRSLPWEPVMVVPPLAVCLLVVVLWWALRSRTAARAGWVVLAAVLCAYLCAVGTRLSTQWGFVFPAGAIIAKGSNGYFLTALEAPDPMALARAYPSHMPSLATHAATQSPGAMLLHAGLRTLFVRLPTARALARALLGLAPGAPPEDLASLLKVAWDLDLTGSDLMAATLIALVFPLAWALGAIAVFALARRVSGVRAALIVTALYAVTPSLVWFTPSVDQIYPPLATVIALLLYAGLRSRRSRPALLLGAGALTGLGVFLNFGFSVMAAIGACGIALAVPGRRRERGRLGRSARELGLFAAGMIGVLLLVQFGLGIDLIGAARVSGGLRDRLYAQDTPRPWLTWFLLNPVEFAIGLGLSSTAVVLGAVARWRRNRGAGVTVLWAVLLTLLLVNLSGAARAEWSRMLMFTMPLLLAGASGALGPLGLRRPGLACALVFAQGAYALIGYQLFEVWGFWATVFR